jgi:hypothetical protein
MAKDVQYDRSVIQTFANSLYAQANSIIAVCTIIGVVIGGVGGYFVPIDDMQGILAGGGAIIVGLIGFQIGRQRAFALKLQAQTALCQAKIEENTGKP